MNGWLLIIGVGVLLGAGLIVWKKIKPFLPASWTGAATNAIAKASDVATDAVTAAAFRTLALAAWANSDLTFLTKLTECRELQKKWGAATTPPVPTATVTTVTGEKVEVPTTQVTL